MVDGSIEGYLNGWVSHELHMYNLNCNPANSYDRRGHFYNHYLGKEDNLMSQEVSNPNYQFYDY
jgi:hypothetical protein